MSKQRRRILILANAFILISTIIITLRGVFRGSGKGQLGNSMIGLGYFKAFTIDANILNGVVSFMIIRSIIKEKYNKHFRLTKDLLLWQFVAASATGLSLFVVVSFLSPMLSLTGRSYFIAFYKDIFYFHFLNPILACCLFVYSYKDYQFGNRENILATLPMIIYAIVYVICALMLKIWPDFYGLAFGGQIWITLLVIAFIYLINYFIGKLLIYFHNRYVKIER